MGSTLYNSSDRYNRAVSSGYFSKSVDDVFEQNKVRRIHESMEPQKAIIREARDSDVHPWSVPIIIALDVTGSMGKIPHYLIKDGLPKIMDTIMERGIKDSQILFLAIGDGLRDTYPLQVGQFESGDVELDTWLTRTYLEGGGGGNGGESYHLAWLFAGKNTVTDAWEKRGQKGFLFTIGDEPCHDPLPANIIRNLTNNQVERSMSNQELLELAKEKYNVYHLQIMEGAEGRSSLRFWKNLLGEHCIEVNHHEDVAKLIAETVTSNTNLILEVPETLTVSTVSDENML